MHNLQHAHLPVHPGGTPLAQNNLQHPAQLQDNRANTIGTTDSDRGATLAENIAQTTTKRRENGDHHQMATEVITGALVEKKSQVICVSIGLLATRRLHCK